MESAVAQEEARKAAAALAAEMKKAEVVSVSLMEVKEDMSEAKSPVEFESLSATLKEVTSEFKAELKEMMSPMHEIASSLSRSRSVAAERGPPKDKARREQDNWAEVARALNERYQKSLLKDKAYQKVLQGSECSCDAVCGFGVWSSSQYWWGWLIRVVVDCRRGGVSSSRTSDIGCGGWEFLWCFFSFSSLRLVVLLLWSGGLSTSD